MRESGEKFIGALIREELFPDRNQIIQSLARAVEDWPEVFLALRDANILPLLYPPLKAGLIPDFPPDLARRIKSECFRTAAINEIHIMEYREIREEFDSAGISALPLKGLELAWTVYPDPGLRPMQDMDFLVRKDDADGARDILIKRGYQVIPRYNFRRRPGAEYEIPMYKPGSPRVQLELHWDLIDRFGIKTGFRADPDAFTHGAWDRAKKRDFLDHSTPMLSPEDHLLVIAFHLAKHGYRLCQSAPDFYRYASLHRHELDWDAFVRATADAGMERPVFYSLRVLERLGGSAWPDRVTNALSPGHGDIKLFDFVMANRGAGAELDEVLYWLWLGPGGPRIKAALRYLLPGRDQLANAVGRDVSLASYPLYLAGRYSRWIGNLARLAAKKKDGR